MRHQIYILLLFLVIDTYSQNKLYHDFLISDVTIIDTQDGRLLPHQWIGVDSNRISKIYYSEVLPSDSTIIINGQGKFLIPGLWDMHIHYHNNYELITPLLLANGIVGIREMNGDMSNIRLIRNLIKSGALTGPEIISSGPIIEGANTQFPTFDSVLDSTTAIEVVKKQKSHGVDFLKVYNKISRESYFAIVAQARKYNLDIAGHVPMYVSAFEVIQAGQKSIEHNFGLLEATVPQLDSLRRVVWSKPFKVNDWKIQKYTYVLDHFDIKLFDDLIDKLANSNTWLCPTLVATKGQCYRLDSAFVNDYRNKYIPDYILDVWNEPIDTTLVLVMKRKHDFENTLLKKMIDRGVKFLAGTDFAVMSTYPGFSLHDELQLFNDAGLTPLQCLQTATINPALYLNKLTDYGTIDETKIASFLLLNSNPLLDISNTKDIESVFLKGKFISKTEIERILQTKNNK